MSSLIGESGLLVSRSLWCNQCRVWASCLLRSSRTSICRQGSGKLLLTTCPVMPAGNVNLPLHAAKAC